MRLKDRLNSGDFAIPAEMEPPKGADASRMVNTATRVKGAVDAFLIPERSNAVMRMSSLGGALIPQQRGLEAISG